MLKIVSGAAIDEVKLRLNSIIEIQSEDSFKNHLRDFFTFKNQGVVNGNVRNNDFSLWIQEQGKGGVTGIFYPVILGYLISQSSGTQIQIKTKMNAVGFILFLLLTAAISYSVINGIIIQEDNSLRFIIPRILVNMLFLGLGLLLPVYIYLRTARIVKDYLIEKLSN